MLPTDVLALVRRHAVPAAQCERWVRGIYAARPRWTPSFDACQFTLGRAFYTHREEDCEDSYFHLVEQSDALVERFAPGLQERMLDFLSELVGTRVARRDGWCGPGVHVFPAGGWLALHGGDVHFDVDGLLDEHCRARATAVTAVLMLQPPEQGGGLCVWERRFDEREIGSLDRVAHEIIEYGPGDLVAIDSYRLHQIQPFGGARDRLSATAHAVLNDGAWEAWF